MNSNIVTLLSSHSKDNINKGELSLLKLTIEELVGFCTELGIDPGDVPTKSKCIQRISGHFNSIRIAEI